MTRETAVICHYRNIQLSRHWVMSAASCTHCHQAGLWATHLSRKGLPGESHARDWLPSPIISKEVQQPLPLGEASASKASSWYYIWSKCRKDRLQDSHSIPGGSATSLRGLCQCPSRSHCFFLVFCTRGWSQGFSSYLQDILCDLGQVHLGKREKMNENQLNLVQSNKICRY